MRASSKSEPVIDLSIREFLAKTNKERPEITGGCVLLTNASFTAVMVLMALRISIKKSEDSKDKRFLKKQVRLLSSLQVALSEAAEHDLKIFDEYRGVLRSRGRDKAKRLDLALSKATDSLLDVCKVLALAVRHTEEAKPMTHYSVLSDVEAGLLILNALRQAVIALANANISSLPEAQQPAYEQWKENLQLH